MNYVRLPSTASGAQLRPEHWTALLQDRLSWRYGPDRAALIVSGGDEASNRDLAAWRQFGRPA